MTTDARVPKITATAQTETVFFEALGRALARWQYIETAMYVLAHALMRTTSEISSIAFFHIRSAEQKLALLEKLCRHGVPQAAYQTRWIPLRKSMANPIEVRNSMAHFEPTWVDDEYAKSTSELNMVIYTHHLDIHANRDGGKGLNVEALRQAEREFRAMAGTMIKFAADCVPDWPQQAASLPQRLQPFLQEIPKTATTPRPAPPRGSSPG